VGNSPVNTKAGEKAGGRGTPGMGAEVPL